MEAQPPLGMEGVARDTCPPATACATSSSQNLPSTTLQTLWPTSSGPFRYATPVLSEALEPIIPHTSALVYEQVPTDLLALTTFYFQNRSTLHTSKEAISQLLSLQPDQIEPLMGLLSCCLYHSDKSAKISLEQSLSRAGLRCVCYVDMSRYDETPMKVAKKKAKPAIGRSSASASPAAPATSASSVHVERPAPESLSQARVATTTKLFACEQKFGVLLETLVADDEGGAQFFCFVGAGLSLIQMLQQNTATNMVRALKQISTTSSASSSFDFKVRATCTDKHPANHLAERMIMESLDETWCQLHIDCQCMFWHELTRTP